MNGNEAYVDREFPIATSKVLGDDYDVILHSTLHTVQDLPVQESRLRCNPVIETFKITDLLLCAESGFLAVSVPEWKASLPDAERSRSLIYPR